MIENKSKSYAHEIPVLSSFIMVGLSGMVSHTLFPYPTFAFLFIVGIFPVLMLQKIHFDNTSKSCFYLSIYLLFSAIFITTASDFRRTLGLVIAVLSYPVAYSILFKISRENFKKVISIFINFNLFF